MENTNNFDFQKLQVQLDEANRTLDLVEAKIKDALQQFNGTETGTDKMTYDILQAYAKRLNSRVRNFKCSFAIRNISEFFSENERKDYNRRLKNYDSEEEKRVQGELTLRLTEKYEDILRQLSGCLDMQFYMKSYKKIMMLYLYGTGEIAFDSMRFEFTVNIVDIC